MGLRREGDTKMAPAVGIKRAYAPASPADGWRVLVDRIWPRGIRREALALDDWRPELAPSTDLRRWFGHDPARWDEFRRRYRSELSDPDLGPSLGTLAERARHPGVTLVFSARDEQRNQAVVLAEVVRERLASGGDAAGSSEVAAAGAGDSGSQAATFAGSLALVEAVERLVRGGVAITTRALLEHPTVDLTLQQWRVLVLVVDAGVGLRITEIAARVGVSVPSASRLVGRLDERGLVASSRDPADHRATLVRPTPRGRRVTSAVLERRRRLIGDALASVDAGLPLGITDALGALAAALEHLS